VSLPTHPVPDPHADPLVASALRAASGGEAGDCPDAELVALYAERELDGSAHADVEAHVHGCARCQAMVAALVRAMPAGAPSAVAEAEAATGSGFAAWFAGWRWLVPAASLTAVAVVAVWVGRGPADQVAESSRVAGAAAERDHVVVPPPSAATEAAESQDRLLTSRMNPEALAPSPPVQSPTTGERGEPAAKTLERAYQPRQTAPATAPPAPRLAETQERAASGARPAPAEQRAANETARQRESAAAAPPPPPAAMAPAAPARSADPVFRSDLAASSWRVSRGVVERSRDGLAWERVAVPAGVTVIAVASVAVDVCWAITADAVFVVTDGVTWTRTSRPPAGPLTSVSATSARAATVTAGGTGFVTTDGGATWAPVR